MRPFGRAKDALTLLILASCFPAIDSRFSGRCAGASAWARERADAAEPAIWRICPLLASCTSNAEAIRIVTRHVWPWRRLGCFTIANAARVFCRGFRRNGNGQVRPLLDEGGLSPMSAE
ncbi:hypothetical protein GFL80_15470 [Rhizobium leguminosarum bv. viciae]|nr:hypothetical protein [Rhizobium leguminosarum bv. viciae]NKK85636.1 hypothetical protein [Rhizobium leguminosarum bv. viciae]